jgi:hypothetical protein
MMLADDLIDDTRLLEPPVPWNINWWLVGAAIVVLLVLWRFVRFCQQRAAARGQARAVEHAHTDALAELERLFALVDQEQSRPYAIESSAIIRRYIETRFDLSAPRRSTEEFLAEAEQSPKLAPAYQTLLGDFLGACDLLKFARTSANRGELKQLHEAAVRFVRETHAPAGKGAA